MAIYVNAHVPSKMGKKRENMRALLFVASSVGVFPVKKKRKS